jgi:hypothetical protein
VVMLAVVCSIIRKAVLTAYLSRDVDALKPPLKTSGETLELCHDKSLHLFPRGHSHYSPLPTNWYRLGLVAFFNVAECPVGSDSRC